MTNRNLGATCACWAALLLLTSPAHAAVTPAGPIAADASDTLSGAQPIDRLSGTITAAIDRPGDHDWYSLRGTQIGDTWEYLDVSIVAAGTGCIAAQPLLVELRNPEGSWIRTYAVSTTKLSLPIPSLPSRYYFNIRAADAACVGLQYRLGRVFLPGAEAVLANVTLCRIAHNERVRAATRLRKLTRRRHALRSRAARRRYAHYLKAQRGTLRQARAYERRQCAHVG
jgi:hypothetical protein